MLVRRKPSKEKTGKPPKVIPLEIQRQWERIRATSFLKLDFRLITSNLK